MLRGFMTPVRRAVVAGAVGPMVLLAMAWPASAQRPLSHSAAGAVCKLSRKDWTSFGYSYFEWLWVNRTSCATGRSVAHAHGHLRGWRCSRKITAQASFQYDATETCTSGARAVQWKYTQNR